MTHFSSSTLFSFFFGVYSERRNYNNDTFLSVFKNYDVKQQTAD